MCSSPRAAACSSATSACAATSLLLMSARPPPLVRPELSFSFQSSVYAAIFGKQLQSSFGQNRGCAGTPNYMSPEVVKELPYSKPTDVWALGCLLHDICALRPAFHSFDVPGLVAKIRAGKVPLLPRRYSDELRSLGRWMLRRDEEQRPSAQDVLDAPVLAVCFCCLPRGPVARRQCFLSPRPSEPRMQEARQRVEHLFGPALAPGTLQPRYSPSLAPAEVQQLLQRFKDEDAAESAMQKELEEALAAPVATSKSTGKPRGSTALRRAPPVRVAAKAEPLKRMSGAAEPDPPGTRSSASGSRARRHTGGDTCNVATAARHRRASAHLPVAGPEAGSVASERRQKPAAVSSKARRQTVMHCSGPAQPLAGHRVTVPVQSMNSVAEGAEGNQNTIVPSNRRASAEQQRELDGGRSASAAGTPGTMQDASGSTVSRTSSLTCTAVSPAAGGSRGSSARQVASTCSNGALMPPLSDASAADAAAGAAAAAACSTVVPRGTSLLDGALSLDTGTRSGQVVATRQMLRPTRSLAGLPDHECRHGGQANKGAPVVRTSQDLERSGRRTVDSTGKATRRLGLPRATKEAAGQAAKHVPPGDLMQSYTAAAEPRHVAGTVERASQPTEVAADCSTASARQRNTAGGTGVLATAAEANSGTAGAEGSKAGAQSASDALWLHQLGMHAGPTATAAIGTACEQSTKTNGEAGMDADVAADAWDALDVLVDTLAAGRRQPAAGTACGSTSRASRPTLPGAVTSGPGEHTGAGLQSAQQPGLLRGVAGGLLGRASARRGAAAGDLKQSVKEKLRLFSSRQTRETETV